jgi:hypothetical protein
VKEGTDVTDSLSVSSADSGSASWPPPDGIDISVAHPARIWNYWLGGKDNYPADRQMSDQLLTVLPDLAVIARADREFLERAVQYLVGEAGIRQFLDIGTGLPTANNTHQVAQAIAPESRVVYVDNDPLILAHARALLVGTPQGATDYIHADLREPDAIVAQAARTLDFSRPIALTLLAILEFIPDTDDPYGIVNRLMDTFAPGSHLVIAHPVHSEAMDRIEQIWNDSGAAPVTFRSQQQLTRFFDRLDLLEPGLVPLPQWRPRLGTLYADHELALYGGVGKKT